MSAKLGNHPSAEPLDALVRGLGSIANYSGLASEWPEISEHPALVRANAAVAAAADAISLVANSDGGRHAIDDLREAVHALTAAARVVEELRSDLDVIRQRSQLTRPPAHSTMEDDLTPIDVRVLGAIAADGRQRRSLGDVIAIAVTAAGSEEAGREALQRLTILGLVQLRSPTIGAITDAGAQRIQRRDHVDSFQDS